MLIWKCVAASCIYWKTPAGVTISYFVRSAEDSLASFSRYALSLFSRASCSFCWRLFTFNCLLASTILGWRSQYKKCFDSKFASSNSSSVAHVALQCRHLTRGSLKWCRAVLLYIFEYPSILIACNINFDSMSRQYSFFPKINISL